VSQMVDVQDKIEKVVRRRRAQKGEPLFKVSETGAVVISHPEPGTDATFKTSETGGMKGKKRPQLGTIDPQALLQLAAVGGMGAEKYERYNFLKGYDWSLAFDAMMRHALLFWDREDNDPESGLSHMAHAAFMALVLVSFAKRGLGTDDRPAVD
jgi:Domain of unknown function (DUF5664)